MGGGDANGATIEARSRRGEPGTAWSHRDPRRQRATIPENPATILAPIATGFATDLERQSPLVTLMKNLLFLCTGNYYRSRFCEEYFNHQAHRTKLAWRAASRGLAPDITVFRNPGPLSPHARQALNALGVTRETSRDPLSARPADFVRAERHIALSRAEHQPMVEQFFPAYAPVVEYWEVGDLPLEAPPAALEKMAQAVHRLIDALHCGDLPERTPLR
jgi:protein-tyrosine phosphatase